MDITGKRWCLPNHLRSTLVPLRWRQQDQDTFHDCRPIEWHGQPSVTCLGDETTFIHTPYNRNSVAEKLFVAVDSWLILAYAAPGIYREILKMAWNVRNVWTGSTGKIPVTINDEDKNRGRCTWINWRISWKSNISHVVKRWLGRFHWS